MTENTNYDLSGAKFGGGFAAEGGIQIGGQFVDTSQKQDLKQAAEAIQDLLSHLSTTYPSDTNIEQMMVATKAIEEIEKNPELKERIIGALKSGGTEALRELIDHPAVSIVFAAIEGWRKPDS